MDPWTRFREAIKIAIANPDHEAGLAEAKLALTIVDELEVPEPFHEALPVETVELQHRIQGAESLRMKAEAGQDAAERSDRDHLESLSLAKRELAAAKAELKMRSEMFEAQRKAHVEKTEYVIEKIMAEHAVLKKQRDEAIRGKNQARRWVEILGLSLVLVCSGWMLYYIYG